MCSKGCFIHFAQVTSNSVPFVPAGWLVYEFFEAKTCGLRWAIRQELLTPMVEESSSLDSLHASLSLNKVERLLKADETKALEEMLASTNMMAIDPLDPGFAANPDNTTSLADLQDDPILAQLPAKVDGQDATAAGLVAQEGE